MKKADITYLACRILAIYIFFRALQHLSYLPLFFPGSAEPVMKVLMSLTVLVPSLILAGLSAALWIFAGHFVQYLLPNSEELGEQVLMINIEEIYAIAFVIVGVVIVAITIPEFFQAIPNITVVKIQCQVLKRISQQYWWGPWVLVILFVIIYGRSTYTLSGRRNRLC